MLKLFKGDQIQVNNTKNYFYASIFSKALKGYDKDIFVQSGVLAKQTKKALILLIFAFYCIFTCLL